MACWAESRFGIATNEGRGAEAARGTLKGTVTYILWGSRSGCARAPGALFRPC